ncbi:hypothetical protein, partial [Methylomonas albis]
DVAIRTNQQITISKPASCFRYQDKCGCFSGVLLSLYGQLYRYVPCARRSHVLPSTGFGMDGCKAEQAEWL